MLVELTFYQLRNQQGVILERLEQLALSLDETKLKLLPILEANRGFDKQKTVVEEDQLTPR